MNCFFRALFDVTLVFLNVDRYIKVKKNKNLDLSFGLFRFSCVFSFKVMNNFQTLSSGKRFSDLVGVLSSLKDLPLVVILSEVSALFNCVDVPEKGESTQCYFLIPSTTLIT